MSPTPDREPEYIEITPDTLEPSEIRRTFDMESGFSYFNPLFLLLCGILIGVFIIQVSQGLFDLSDTIDMTNFTYRFANYREGGNHIGIITSIFLHAGVGHLLGNLIFLYVFSLVSYRVIGFSQSLAVFMITGFIGWIVSFYLGDGPSVGASGAIFGMFGLLSVFYLRKRDELSENLEDLSWGMISLAILAVIAGFSSPFIDNFAHVGWFVAGCILGYILFWENYHLAEK